MAVLAGAETACLSHGGGLGKPVRQPERVVGVAAEAFYAARYREQEYERALADYRRLARHRLANPLTAIRGGVSALRTLPDLDDERRAELLAMIEREALRLEHIALDPATRTPEESTLHPQPRVKHAA